MHPGWLALSAVALSHLGSIARLRHGSAPSLAPASDASPVRPAGGLAGVGRAIRQIEVPGGHPVGERNDRLERPSLEEVSALFAIVVRSAQEFRGSSPSWSALQFSQHRF